jgi:flagellar hook-associated protein 2
VEVETAGNSYTIDGTTFTFAPHAAPGEFRVEVGNNRGAAAEAIKNFVNDYNQLIDDIFGMLQERRATGNYHFLTDQDIEDGGLSDRQIEQWERLAKQGILRNDSAISSVMSGLRNAMMSTVRTDSGRDFGLFNIRGSERNAGMNDGPFAIRPSPNFQDNGKLILDEQALMQALESNPEDIINLFTDPQNGLMVRLERELDRAIKTTGAPEERGTLILRAGTATGQSATENTIYERIKSLNRTIDTLQARYDRQQDRYWRMFTAMESQFAVLNSQSTHIMSMFNSMLGNQQQ